MTRYYSNNTPNHHSDGAKGAPAGRPQFPKLLSAYRTRAPWRVAGVDYAVGISPGHILKDPTLADHLPRGVSLDAKNRIIRVDGNNITLDGYDFSLHGGFIIYITGANVTISNSNLSMISNSSYSVLDQSKTGGLIINNNVMDQSRATNASGFIGYESPGAVVLKYNWFRNFPQHVLELVEKDGMKFSVTYEYNLISEGALRYKAHMNFMQFASGSATSVDVEFNTTVQTPQVSAGEGFQLDSYGKPAAAIQFARISNNTMIAAGERPGSSMSLMLHGGGSNVKSCVIIDNYFDTTGAYGAFYPTSFSNVLLNGNIDMVSGRVINAENVRA